MSADYKFKLTNGQTLGTILPLEGNGPNAMSVPRQILNIDFSTTPETLVVDGDITARFPPAAMADVAISAVVTGLYGSFTVVGNYTTSSQVAPGNHISIKQPGASVTLYKIKSSSFDGTNTTLVVDGTIPTDITNAGTISTVFVFSITRGPYAGVYRASRIGATYDGIKNSRIPLSTATPLVRASTSIIAANSTSFTTQGIDNAADVFYSGSVITVSGNSNTPVNGTYHVTTTVSSGTHQIIGTDVGTKTFTITGNVTPFFVPGVKFTINWQNISKLVFTVSSATSTGGSTDVVVVEDIPSSAVGASAVPVPVVSVISVAENIPAATPSGRVTASAPKAFAFSAPPAIEFVSAGVYDITWRIAGDQTSIFSAGTVFLVKDNTYYRYNALRAAVVTLSSGMTHITTRITGAAATPIIDATGYIVYPVAPVPFGYLEYDVPGALTALQLVGKGAPSYNRETTWGEALQSNMIHSMEHFASGVRATVNAVSGPLITISGDHMGNTALKPNMGISLTDSTQTVRTGTIASTYLDNNHNTVIQLTTAVTASVGDLVRTTTSVPPSPWLDGQLWFDASTPQLWVKVNGVPLGLVIQTVPVQNFVDMNGNKLINLGDATSPTDATNLRTTDNLYIAKTGGISSNQQTRSGTMTGSLNINVPPSGTSDAVGLNVTNAPVAMYGSSKVTFPAGSLGGLEMHGNGGVQVDTASVVVGTGADTVVTTPTGITISSATPNSDSLNMGLNHIVNLAAPTRGTDAANKAYVDSLSSGIVWLQPVLDPNLFDDTRTAPPFVEGAIIAVTIGATNSFTVAGTWSDSFYAGQILGVYGNDTHSANTTYVVVSANVSGGNTVIQVSANTIPVDIALNGTLIDNTIPMAKTYYVNGTGTGGWASFANAIVSYTLINTDPVTQVQTWGWVDILGRSPRVGDRFGIFVDPDSEDPLTKLPTGGLTGQAGKIATVSAISPITYTFYTPVDPYAFSVTGASPTMGTNDTDKSPHFGHSYTFRGVWGTGSYGVNYKWIPFNGPSMIVAGAGLRYKGNTINIGQGTGIAVSADSVSLDLNYMDAQYMRRDGAYPMVGPLNMGAKKITALATPTANTDASTKAYVDTTAGLRVLKAGDTMTGNLVMSGTAKVTGLPTPTVATDAVPKSYVDAAVGNYVLKAGDTMTGNLVMSGTAKITQTAVPTGPGDLTNKTYVDAKVSRTGDTMTGALVLYAMPTADFEAVPRKYVTDNYVSKSSSTTLKSGVNLTFTNGGINGLADPVNPQDAATKSYVDWRTSTIDESNLVHKTLTETISGNKTFTGVVTIDNAAQGSTFFAVKDVAGASNPYIINATPTALVLQAPYTAGTNGNYVSILGGNSGSSTGNGGFVSVSGQGGANNGGSVNIYGGDGGTGTGGNFTVSAGSTNSSQSAGKVIIYAGNNIGTGKGGDITITSGTGGSASQGGNITLTASAGGASYPSGSISLTATNNRILLTSGTVTFGLNPAGSIELNGAAPTAAQQAIVSTSALAPQWQTVVTAAGNSTVTGNLYLANDPTTANGAATKNYVDTTIAASVPPAITVRQTVTTGPTIAYLTGVNSNKISVTGLSTTYPLVVTAAQGFGTNGAPKDKTVAITTNTLSWTGLPDGTSYLYLDISPTNVVTAGSTKVKPIYQEPRPTLPIGSSANPFNFFSITDMAMYNDDGTAITQLTRVYIGETNVNAGLVASITQYAYNGRYVSTTTPTWGTAKLLAQWKHKIGVVPRSVTTALVCNTTDNGWPAGSMVTVWFDDQTTANRGMLVGVDALSITAIAGGTGLPTLQNLTTPATSFTVNANWGIYQSVSRGW